MNLNSPRFVVAEAFQSVCRRFLRNALALMSVVLGVAGLVASVGLSQTSSNEISRQFIQLQARELTVSGFDPSSPYAASVFERVDAIQGIVASGLYQATERAQVDLSNVPGVTVAQAPVIAATPGAVEALGMVVEYGRTLHEANVSRADKVVFVGAIAARQMGLSTDSLGSSIFLNGSRFLLAGVISAEDPLSLLPYAAIVPYGADLDVALADPLIAVRTEPGIAAEVADSLSFAVRPDNPDAVSVTSAPSPENLRAGIEEQTAALVRVLGVVLLGVGAFGIANTLLLGVLERRYEIGVRRTVGTSSGEILGQFLLEGLFVGLIGGVLGFLAGVLLVDLVSLFQGLDPVIPPILGIMGPAVGAVVGTLAAGYPAFRAARVQPAEALRS